MRKFIWANCFLLFISKAGAQDIESTLANYSKNYSEERIYVHYDKPLYTPGETIWFKAYLMKSIFPADDCRTLYVDWIDSEGNLLSHSVFPVEEGTTFGQFEIPAAYAGKVIHVKAYTKWMLNFDSSFLYDKILRVLSPSQISDTAPTVIPELNFFPEGGDAIVGVTNKIAFKANDQYGRPVAIKGVVKDAAGAVVDSLKTIHDGMGFCVIRPNDAQLYSAQWQDENGQSHTTQLPGIKNSGIGMHIFINGNERTFVISVCPSSLGAIKKVHILGTMYQQKIFNLDEEVTDGAVQGTISTGTLPTGILCITVFDDEWRPLAERITYVNNHEYVFNPEVSVENLALQKRGKNEIQISVPGNIASDLSVSITDAKIGYEDNDNIISHLLLTGQLKGKINDPAYYFLNNSDSIAQQLDLVMLTNGWRRFNWESLMQGQFPVVTYAPDTSYVSLAGRIIGATPSELKAAGNIILMVKEPGSGTQTFTGLIGSDGSFSDSTIVLYDTTRVFYSFSNSKALKKASIEFLGGLISSFPYYAPADSFYQERPSDTSSIHYQLDLSDETKRELEYFKGKVLETVNIKSRIKSPKEILNDRYTSGLFKNNNATELDLIDDPLRSSYFDLVTYIENKVPGLTYDNVASKFLWMRNRSGENGPTIFLNEMATSSATLSTLPVSDVAYIKVFHPGWVGGGGVGSGGAIAIYTREGAEGGYGLTKGLDNGLVLGYTISREFYSPDYTKVKEDDNRKDLRTTLYWNPSLITVPEQNKVNITFFNNDITKSFKVVVEGMTRDGRLAHIEQTIR